MTTSASDDQGFSTDAASPGTDPGDTTAALRDLASSIALLPQVSPPEGADQPEGAIALPVIEQDGQRYIPVFTSEDALRSAGADPGTALRIPIAALAANWPSDDMWLAVNPASEDGLGLPPDVVRALPVFAGGQDGAGENAPG
ncbi:SseB family protein [Pseudonocardia sp. H11422]|uniref:SseB family protein n=1 Tax=Pseudonocardia sp. H11422 TaxID=2835866 RepID=UPI001BDCA22C|nr:SseB family protein [Pseudonocardia sp. H11422]